MRCWSWLGRISYPHRWLLLGLLVLFTASRLSIMTGWDDTFYVAQLTSAVADHDLLLQDDLLAFPRPLGERLRSITTILDSGAVQNTFSVGFAVIHGTYAWPFIALSGERAGAGLRNLLALGSLAFLVIAVLATVRLLERWGFGAAVSRLATGIAFISSPLALFGTRVYLNSHLLSALLASLVFLAFLRMMQSGATSDAVLAGLASGFLVINRWQDGLLLVALLPALFVSLARPPVERRLSLVALTAAAGSFASVSLLQMLAWRAQFSTWLLVPQGSGYIDWTAPHFIQMLLSPYHGVVLWAPGLALGLAVVAFLEPPAETPTVRRMRRGLLLALQLLVYIAAAPRDWWAGASYGPRRLTTLAPVAALGLAGVLHRVRPWLRLVIAGLLSLWAVITASAYFSGFDDLFVLLRGTPGPFNPQDATAYADVHWIDRLGPFHALKPGFTFSDQPHSWDRVVGVLASAALVFSVTGGWHYVRRHVRAQRVILAGALTWVAVCICWLAVVIPRNDDWNRRWLAVVRSGPEPRDGRPFPPGVVAAAGVLEAVRALERGDEAGFQDRWCRLGSTFGLREHEVRALVSQRRAEGRVPGHVPTAAH